MGSKLRTGRPRAGAPAPNPSRLALMRNHVMPYSWGCTRSLAELQGREPTGQPEAELWMGAHPAGTSHVVDEDGHELDLGAAIATDPAGMLGDDCVTRFGPRLPFMLKILAIDSPLSIQVHPSEAQARRGYDAEQAAGVPAGSPERRYVDPHGKPEQFVALSPMSALVGLRPAREVAELLDLLGASSVGTLREIVLAGGTGEAFLAVCTMPAESRAGFVAGVRNALQTAGARAHEAERPAAARAFEWSLRIAALHPDDPLCIAPLLMQLHELATGESVFIAAGVPHAYLAGLAVEVLCASDNVARAGLTSKRVDAALFRTWMDAAATVERVQPVRAWWGVTWRVPVEEFSLGCLQVDGATAWLGSAVPRVVVCTEGQVTLASAQHRVALTAGASAFLAPHHEGLHVSGEGTVFVAAAGSADPHAWPVRAQAS